MVLITSLTLKFSIRDGDKLISQSYTLPVPEQSTAAIIVHHSQAEYFVL
ncbi:MAG: hypothetical protein AABX15_00530 [Thermoproteota archaeon]|nr:hypothetical protein [Nitrosopumilaceae archaeon]